MSEIVLGLLVGGITTPFVLLSTPKTWELNKRAFFMCVIGFPLAMIMSVIASFLIELL